MHVIISGVSGQFSRTLTGTVLKK